MHKMTKLLAILILLPIASAHTATFTWVGTTDDITDSNNWNPFGVPTTGDETDFNSTATSLTPTLDSSSTAPLFDVDLIEIDNTTSAYNFFISDGTKLNLSGADLDPSGVGVTNRTRGVGGVPLGFIQNFYVDNGAILEFDRNTSADIGYSIVDYQLPPFIVYTLGSSGTASFMNFNGNAQGGAAGYNLHNGSLLTFDNMSLAGVPQINMDTNSILNFTKLSNAGGAIVNATNSSVIFDTAAKAFFSIFNLDNSPITFMQGSDLGSITINAINGTAVSVRDLCLTTGRATINLVDSSLTYTSTADAGQSTIIADNSAVSFQNFTRLSSLATISLSNNSALEFTDSADAGISKIFADSSTVTFGNFNNINPFPNSSNSSVVLNNGSLLTVNNFANFQNLQVLDPASVVNFNNFQATPMTFNSTGPITNGHININPFGPTASGPIVFANAFNSYPSLTVHRGTLIGNSLNIVGNIVNNGNIVFNQIFSQNFFGTITGPGNIVLKGGGTLFVDGTHTISGTAMEVIDQGTTLQIQPALLSLSALQIGDSALVDFEVPRGQTQTFNGFISDVSSQQGAIAINKGDGEGTAILSNPLNNYTGGTTLYAGTLQINNAVGVPGILRVEDNDASVVFNQQIDNTYNGQVFGPGFGFKTGPAKLTFPQNTQNEFATFDVLQGQLELLGSLISPKTNVAQPGILSGNGTLKGSLEVFGTLTPGPGTFKVIGDVEFEPGSIYQVAVLGNQASLLHVTSTDDDDDNQGKAVIEENAGVEVIVDGSYNQNTTYTIVSSDTLRLGEFSFATINNPLLFPTLTYDKQHVYLQIKNALTTIGTTFNQKQVAKQLAQINTSDPLVNDFLLELLQLPPKQAQEVFDELSAEQYTQIFTTAQGVNQRFIHRLFDPLREIVSSEPCDNQCFHAAECVEDMLGDDFCTKSMQPWIDVSFDRGYYKGNRNASGYKTHGYEISLGIQTEFYNCWTVGLAATYEKDLLHFNVGGTGKNHIWLGGLYTLYRPQNYYVLADVILGKSSQQVKRSIHTPRHFFKAKGKPNIVQGASYIEGGIDYRVTSCLLVQPFLGLEIDYYHLHKFHEKKHDFFAIHANGKSQTDATSRLGVHFTANSCLFLLSIDLAWQYRFNSTKNNFHEHFINFGNDFYIKGIPLHRNSLDGAVYLSTAIADGWEIYGEAAGKVAQHAAMYDILLGVKAAF